MPLERAAASFGWGELVNFARHLPLDSAVRRAEAGDVYEWATTAKTNAILADLFDAVRLFNATFGKKNSRPPEPYPRPGGNGGAKRIGSGAMPIAEFNEWYYGGGD